MTSDTAPPARLLDLWAEITDLAHALHLLEWDQETYLPTGGQEARGHALATLTGLRHRKLSDPELVDVLAACHERAEETGDAELAAQVRVARREVDRAVRVPEELAMALARAESAGLAAWREAREADDAARFEPALERLVSLKREQAQALSPDTPDRPYDALLDVFEPGSTEARVAELFDELAAKLTPLVERVRDSGVTVDETPAQGSFPEAAQRAFSWETATAFGFAPTAGRLDLAAHPFCSGIARRDVRLTWRFQEDDFRPGLFGVIHETGHGLYEQGLPERWERQPLGTDAGTAVHESQSRLWENHVGRSPGFWRWALPRFREHFPAAPDLELDTLMPTLHVVRPSPIRVEADEVTYALHVIARFDLERALFAGDLDAADLAGAWDDAYERLLGFRPASASDGVLQDIHWAMGLFGYFPTYVQGSLAAAQLFDAARRDLGDLDKAFAQGDFGSLLTWLRESVHHHGARYLMDELLTRATGSPLTTAPLLRHLEAKVAAAYGS